MWYLMADEKCVGYVRIFETKNFADSWFRGLRDKTTWEAFWRNGYPLVAYGERDTKKGNQFVQILALCSVRSFSKHSAAVGAWDRWIAGKLTASDVFVEN
jgi:hypothetical protein